jgi:uncharacterized protein DUF6473
VGRFYQEKDSHLLDYHIEQLHAGWFRGPLERGPDAVAWLGAAQTFGRFVPEPFPQLVGQRLGIGTLNLGSGGKGPEYYLVHPKILEEANRCKLAVVQVMPARGSDNRMFRSKLGGGLGVRTDDKTPVKALELIDELIASGRGKEARELVEESRRNYERAMINLLEAVRIPKILLWFSFRQPPAGILGYRRTLRVSPQFVTREMVGRIRRSADRYVAVASRAGIPQELRDRDGNPAGSNAYYPSPEMHRLAADRLVSVVGELIGSRE